MRLSDNEIGGLIGLVFFGGWIMFCIALLVLKVWLIASLVTSGVKAASGDCGKAYGIEGIVKGNWFCPD